MNHFEILFVEADNHDLFFSFHKSLFTKKKKRDRSMMISTTAKAANTTTGISEQQLDLVEPSKPVKMSRRKEWFSHSRRATSRSEDHDNGKSKNQTGIVGKNTTCALRNLSASKDDLLSQSDHTWSTVNTADDERDCLNYQVAAFFSSSPTVSATDGTDYQEQEEKVLNGSKVKVKEDCAPSILVSSSSTTGQNPLKKKKTVTFKKTGTKRKIMSRRSYTKEEKQASWYRQDEYDAMRMACLKQVRYMEKKLKRNQSYQAAAMPTTSAGSQEGSTRKRTGYFFCDWGLECLTRPNRVTKNRNRQRAYDAVLDEQSLQRARRNRREGGGQSWQQTTPKSELTLLLLEEYVFADSDDAGQEVDGADSTSTTTTFEEEAIANRYRMISESCQMWAAEIGKRYQEEVLEEDM